MEAVSMTIEVPEPLAGRLAAEAARRGVEADTLAVETLEAAYGPTGAGQGDQDDDERARVRREALEAFIGCGRSGDREPFDIHNARAELAARRLAEGA